MSGDVKATVTEVTATGITFITPDVYGNQSVLLKEDGKEYLLGTMTFEQQPDGATDVEILPRKITKIIKSWPDNDYPDGVGQYISAYIYNENELLASETDGAKETATYTYSTNQVQIKEIGGDAQLETFTLENGKAVYYKRTYPHGLSANEYTFTYNGNYLSQIEGIQEN